LFQGVSIGFSKMGDEKKYWLNDSPGEKIPCNRMVRGKVPEACPNYDLKGKAQKKNLFCRETMGSRKEKFITRHLGKYMSLRNRQRKRKGCRDGGTISYNTRMNQGKGARPATCSGSFAQKKLQDSTGYNASGRIRMGIHHTGGQGEGREKLMLKASGGG